MKKSIVIEYFGHGSVTLAARNLGFSVRAISNWQVDKDGNLVSPLVRDRVLARAFRLRMKLLAQKKGMKLDEMEEDFASTACGEPVAPGSDVEDEQQAA